MLFSIIQAAGWPIWPLVACSVLALALVIERFSSLKTRKVAPAKLIEEAITVSRTAIPSPDVVMQLEQSSLLGEVLASGFRALNTNPRLSEEDLRSTLEGAGRQAAHKLERYLAALATIASAAPLLGRASAIRPGPRQIAERRFRSLSGSRAWPAARPPRSAGVGGAHGSQ